ncbi:MAG: hypothetical protein M1837_002321 [Sclerophora amabilis]|nr:MAG: hypothetical protein M1837_002321 [Sclerophora amabilis]
MSSAALNPSKKRKQGPDDTGPAHQPKANTGRAQKRARTQDARKIATQTSDKALKDGQLDVDKFVQAREWEIRALESGMRDAKKALTTRAHQSVPRHMRRRTASHNVKKVPKKLRKRAAKEMKEDNTPVVSARRRKPQTSRARLRLETAKRLHNLGVVARDKKTSAKELAKKTPSDTMQTTVNKTKPKKGRLLSGKVAAPPKPAGIYRKRQIHKSWLPTHIFHAKRAHLTPPKEPLWRFAIPLSPNEKTYRLTHRATSARGAVAWDMSYMSTIALEGELRSIESVLKCIGAGSQVNPGGLPWRRGRYWSDGHRTWEGWLYESKAWPRKPIAPVTLIWCVPDVDSTDSKAVPEGSRCLPAGNVKTPCKRKAFVRVHPSAFLQLWNEMTRIAKRQYPPVRVHDLRFEVGSIEVTGPGSTEALLGTLWPVDQQHPSPTETKSPSQTWRALSRLTNPAALPSNALLAFCISDPRLHHPPRTIPRDPGHDAQEALLNVLSSWPPDDSQGPSELFSRDCRLRSCRQLPSQKSINRRKGLASPGSYPEPLSTDPQIPVILIPSRSSSKSSQGTWTVLMPWRCVLPIWYTLIHYPLSTGETVRFGGLQEKRQVSFEAGTPWFPADFPGTKAGMEWEMTERARRKEDWEKRPKAKRIEWSKVNLGRSEKGEIGAGWSCDWERLLASLQHHSAEPDHNGKIAADHIDNAEPPANIKIKELTADADSPSIAPDPGFYNLPSPLATQLIYRPQTCPQQLQDSLPAALLTVKIIIANRGTFKACARIYRLPSDDTDLRSKWLGLVPSRARNPKTKHPKSNTTASELSSVEDRRRHLAASLLEDPVARTGPPHPGDMTYPEVPGEKDLIGFVTTGNYSLKDGACVGIGCVSAARITIDHPSTRYFIVRDAGNGFGRLARWEIV